MAKSSLLVDFFEEQEILRSTDFVHPRMGEAMRRDSVDNEKAIEKIARKRPQDEVETVESPSAITARSKCDRPAAH